MDRTEVKKPVFYFALPGSGEGVFHIITNPVSISIVT
jgi:hypothetical protein